MSPKLPNPPNRRANNQSGISILLAILILSSLTVITIAMSDIVLRVARSSRQIGYSEIAYYAAETSIEKALYEIEKDKTLTGLDGENGSLEDISDATWSRQVAGLTACSVDCASLGSQEGICVDTPGDITYSLNPLQIQLDPDSSFQLDLNFTDLDEITQNLATLVSVDFVTGSGNGKAIDYNYSTGQISLEQDDFVFELDEDNLHTLRLINNQASQVVFEVSPFGSGVFLPIGILVTGTGDYQGEQRILEIERKNWQIY